MCLLLASGLPVSQTLGGDQIAWRDWAETEPQTGPGTVTRCEGGMGEKGHQRRQTLHR